MDMDEKTKERKQEAPHAQTLSGDAPIPTGERVLQHGPDDHRNDDNTER